MNLEILQKFYIKSNKLCTICGKYVDDFRKIQAVKTKRGNYVIAHVECIKYIN